MGDPRTKPRWRGCGTRCGRSAIVTQRIRDEQVALGHLPDATNFVDMFTKWVKAAKVEESIAYLTGARAREAHAGGDAAGEAAAAPVHAMIATIARVFWDSL